MTRADARTSQARDACVERLRHGRDTVTLSPHAPVLADTLFVTWGFPEPTQTFIHREWEHMEQIGERANVLAAHRIHRDDVAAASPLANIRDRAELLGHPLACAGRGAWYAARHPAAFTRTLAWLVARPHRTPVHRARAVALTVAAASVVDRIRAANIGYVHAHFLAYHTELAMALARLAGVPFGVTAHASGIWKDRNILRDKVAAARVVITCTAHNAAHLRALAPDHAHKVHVVYHGLDLAAVPRPTAMLHVGHTRLLAIGRLIPKKGFDHLVGAVAALRADRDVRLRILGDGPQRSALARRAQDLGVADAIAFTGTVPNDQIWRELADCHALVAPSVRARNGDIDGIPNVILEAMAMARPVVASTLSGIPEAVRDGATGYTTPPGDTGALATAIARIADDPASAEAMGRRGRALVEELFDVRDSVRKQLALIDAARSAST